MSLLKKIYDTIHPFSPECVSCGHKYSPYKSGRVKFEYNPPRTINMPFLIQAYEAMSATFEIDMKYLARHGGSKITSFILTETGIIVCGNCVKDELPDKVVKNAYNYMMGKWSLDRLPDPNEFEATAKPSCD